MIFYSTKQICIVMFISRVGRFKKIIYDHTISRWFWIDMANGRNFCSGTFVIHVPDALDLKIRPKMAFLPKILHPNPFLDF